MFNSNENFLAEIIITSTCFKEDLEQCTEDLRLLTYLVSGIVPQSLQMSGVGMGPAQVGELVITPLTQNNGFNSPLSLATLTSNKVGITSSCYDPAGLNFSKLIDLIAEKLPLKDDVDVRNIILRVIRHVPCYHGPYGQQNRYSAQHQNPFNQNPGYAPPRNPYDASAINLAQMESLVREMALKLQVFENSFNSRLKNVEDLLNK